MWSRFPAFVAGFLITDKSGWITLLVFHGDGGISTPKNMPFGLISTFLNPPANGVLMTDIVSYSPPLRLASASSSVSARILFLIAVKINVRNCFKG